MGLRGLGAGTCIYVASALAFMISALLNGSDRSRDGCLRRPCGFYADVVYSATLCIAYAFALRMSPSQPSLRQVGMLVGAMVIVTALTLLTFWPSHHWLRNLAADGCFSGGVRLGAPVLSFSLCQWVLAHG